MTLAEPAPATLADDQPGEMLKQYYLSHGETSGDLGANGILSRLVTLELRGGELVEVTPAGEPVSDEQPGEEDTAEAASPASEQE